MRLQKINEPSELNQWCLSRLNTVTVSYSEGSSPAGPRCSMFECMRPCDLGPAELVGGTDVAAKTQSHPPLLPLYFQADDVACLRPCATCGLPRRPYVSRPRPCGDGALWEIRSAGASTRAAPSPGHSAAAVPAGDDGCRISVFCLFQPGPGPGEDQRDHPDLGATGVSLLFHVPQTPSL